ncbi:MlaC/ttg2D family ABC transporter substrate-binding protein [Thiolapillus brandeum]|uniref:Toluene tolerance protein n=1 Tax=Thiolapillus brandeum TaxID=1076588 RepID=A0A7U6JG49_9GAMM|nr:ABC transporter substrate-binding protein [Thiolapillus brandeum]BAO43389.1 toluene tolerance protein [Thiolapillus brandeum]
MRYARMLMVVLLLAAGISTAADSEPEPVKLIRSTADYVLQQIRKRKPELEKDSSGIYALVQEKILPHFDFRIMSRGALGRYWRRATEAQKQRIAREFQELLVRTYATTLLNYSDQQVEYLPFRGKPDDRRVTVATRVHSQDGPPVPINYRLYRTSDGRWKIYDVVVDGVSLVSNYRSSFAAEVKKGGIEGLISSLARHNRKQRGA